METTRKKIQEKGDLGFGLTISIVLMYLLGFGLAIALVSYLVYRPACSMFSGFGIVPTITVVTPVFLGFSLIFGMVFGLIFAVVFGLAFRLISGLRRVGNWLLAK